MTIRYALTRTEIVQSYFRSLASSGKFLATILIYSATLGIFSLIFGGAFSRPLQLHDLFVAVAWMLGASAFMPIWLFVRGKTSERSLTVSPDGISTQIDSRTGKSPWNQVIPGTR